VRVKALLLRAMEAAALAAQLELRLAKPERRRCARGQWRRRREQRDRADDAARVADGRRRGSERRPAAG
jgi:hypothetical protein